MLLSDDGRTVRMIPSANGVHKSVVGTGADLLDLDEGKYYHHLNGEWVRGKPGSNQGGDLKLGRLYHAGVTSSSSLREAIDKGWLKINLGERPFAVAGACGLSALHH